MGTCLLSTMNSVFSAAYEGCATQTVDVWVRKDKSIRQGKLSRDSPDRDIAAYKLVSTGRFARFGREPRQG